MKKYILILLLFPLFAFSQKMVSKEVMEVKKFQEDLNAEYMNPEESPLRGDDLKNFKGHPFFPFELKYRITAKFARTKNAKPFEIPTSSGRTKSYRQYGKATFELDGKSYTLALYQSLDLIKQEAYKNSLFLPFRDATNGKETYGGGKYMDLTIPKGNTILLDFNKSYQPFCAYNAYEYSCPIVPEINKLPVEIRAGVMYNDTYHH